MLSTALQSGVISVRTTCLATDNSVADNVFLASRIIVATAVALPASSFCILRRLHKIITAQTIHTSASRNRVSRISHYLRPNDANFCDRMRI